MLGAKAVAIRSLLVGGGLVLLLALLVGTENVRGVRGPVMLALWIAGIVGSCMMTWTRSGARRWVWAAIGTVLLTLLVGLFAVEIR